MKKEIIIYDEAILNFNQKKEREKLFKQFQERIKELKSKEKK
jgi:hypothetical protein